MTDLNDMDECVEGACVECGEEEPGTDCQSCGNALCSRCGTDDDGNMNGRICSDCSQSVTCVYCDQEFTPPEIPQCTARPGEECEDFRGR